MENIVQLPIERFLSTARIVFYIISGLTALIFFALYYMEKKGISLFKKKRDRISAQEAEKVSNLAFVEGIDDLEDNMIICDGGTTFVAAIKVYGKNIGKATKTETGLLFEGMLELLTALDADTQMYDQCTEIDIHDNLKLIGIARENLQQEEKRLADELMGLRSTLLKETDTERKQQLFSELQKVEKFYQNKLWQLEHNSAIKSHAYQITKQEDITNRDSYIICTYEHDNGAFSVDRTPEEVFKLAQRKLETQTDSITRIFDKMRLRSERMVGDKLGEIVYRHFNPIHADMYKFRDKKNGIVANLYVRDAEEEEHKKEFKEKKKNNKRAAKEAS